MKKLLIPAIAIAAVGGYFYYANLESTAPQTDVVVEEEQIVEEVESAVAEAEAAVEHSEDAAGDMMASAEEDVFADVPEAMGHALDETSEAMHEMADEVEGVVEDIDHSEE
ncbi:hypothetical protein HXX02_09225 [Microbulbifer elongatus]|uniref:Uncharacterized protein n=1 Tax=Microbulbifer elongatus TaxID=86173 RepID=A0ABT1P0K2_9GAMM|nr:hypothetical protein [Microbulbifer elongatus]MCQ3829630.1 hypothetical protein [Microbulbifer elongatus]